MRNPHEIFKKTVIILTLIFTMGIPVGFASYFKDTSTHWSFSYDETLQQKCGINGYTDSQGNPLFLYKPDNAATRAELVTMVLKCRSESYDNKTASFSDVEINAWYGKAVAKAKELGLVSGFPDGTFRPNNNVTRAEALKIILLAKFKDTDIISSPVPFKDVEAKSWYNRFIGFAITNHYIEGYKDAKGSITGYFGPNNNITRGEIAKILTKILLQSEESVTPSPAPTPLEPPVSVTPPVSITPPPIISSAACSLDQLFPKDSAWNRNIKNLPAKEQSNGWLKYIGPGNFHPDFGYREYWADYNPEGFGMPVTIIHAGEQPAVVSVNINQWPNPEQNPLQYWPIPLNAKVEAPSDSHLLVADLRPRQTSYTSDKTDVQVGCKLYELLNAVPKKEGWEGSAGSEFDLLSNKPLPAGWTSSDAAGLPVTAGLVTCHDIKKGSINHALRFTVAKSGDSYIAPASHCAPTAPTNERDNAPPMGARLAMNESYYNKLMSQNLDPQAKIIIQALYDYGAFLADNGSNWYFSGARYDDASEDCFSSTALDQLKSIQMTSDNFRFVETGDSMISNACFDGYNG